MAEQEPQPANVGTDCGRERGGRALGQLSPAQKSIQEIQELDKDDESLRKYKEALLGRVAVSAGKWAPVWTPVLFWVSATISPAGGALTCCHCRPQCPQCCGDPTDPGV